MTSKKSKIMARIVSVQQIQQIIFLLRGEKVMLDSDLAELYGVSTKVLNQAVKRNQDRFPKDFMFQLTVKEFQEVSRHQEEESLKSQFVTSKRRGGRRSFPYAFTEQGVAMLSSVLNSKRAIQVNIEIMRTFVRLRQILATHKDLARKLQELEKKYDSQFKGVFEVLHELMASPEKEKRKIGFTRKKSK